MATIHVHQGESHGMPVLTVRGDLDFYTSQTLLGNIQRLQEEAHSRIGLDLTGVASVDESGAALLGTARECLGQLGTQLVIVGSARPRQRPPIFI